MNQYTEHNKETLQKALQSLPTYEAPELCWEQIVGRLDALEGQDVMDQAIESMPVHKAPDALWDRISTELDAQSAPSKPELRSKSIARILHLRIDRRAIGLVAGMAILVIGFSLFMRHSFSEAGNKSLAVVKDSERSSYAVTVSYHEESAARGASYHSSDWSADEEAFRQVVDFCKDQFHRCDQEDFRILRDELLELNDARTEIMAILEHYGQDAELLIQLTSIEQERSALLKQMVDKI